MGAQWLTRTQARQRFGTCEYTIRHWCEQGLLEERPPKVALGRCACGCGGIPPIATRSDRRWGMVKGKPLQFIHGHNNARGNAMCVSTASVERLEGRREALRAAVAAVDAAWHRVAVLAHAGEREALLDATAELAQRKADLLVTRMEGMLDG